MEKSRLGNTDIEVSRLALGTMTFGAQNSAAEAHAQLDQAIDGGITFIDTAELYPAPASAKLYGETERLIGQWLARSGKRQHLILATKVAGPAAYVPWVRGGRSKHDAANLQAAVEGSLVRLGVDCIDLLQLHWPDRATNVFHQRGFKPPQEESDFSIETTLRALEALITTGKIRHIGIANETAWGMAQFLHLAALHKLPHIVSIQNAYNLLQRSFDTGLAEIAWREGCGLLAYAPLAGGLLSGKYFDASASPQARLHQHAKHYRHYNSPAARLAASRYVAIAQAAGIDPAAMALAFVASKPYVTSVIIGATTLAQLADNLRAATITLPRDVMRAIDAVHEEIPNPCP